jgi:hypothetical protein
MQQNIEIVTLLSESSCFSLGLKEGKDVSLPNWSLHIPHDVTILIIQKLHSNLSDLSSGSSATHNFHNNSMLNLWFHPAQTQTHSQLLKGEQGKKHHIYNLYLRLKNRIKIRCLSNTLKADATENHYFIYLLSSSLLKS